MTTIKKNQTTLYSVYCFIVLLVGGICRMVKKAGNGKCGKFGQVFFSLLAFLSLTGTVMVCAAFEAETISWFIAVLGAAFCMLSFSVFAGMAGAFRSYRYMKKKQKHQNCGKVMRIPAEAMTCGKKSA